jgi:site-specific recombinase XerD
VQDIRRRDIRALVDRKAETAPVMANRMLSRISRLFSFEVERDWIDANRAFRIKSPARRRVAIDSYHAMSFGNSLDCPS